MTLRTLFPSVRWLLATLAFAAGAMAFTGQAHASRSQESIFQEDRLLQDPSPAVQAAALDDIKALGAGTIHVVLNWRNFVPARDKGSIPDGFNGADPTSYTASEWSIIDNLVFQAHQRGLQLLFTPAGPAPEWAVTCSAFEKRKYGREQGTCRPDPKLYGDFVTALAKRYSGTYVDPSSGARPGRVSRWSFWNEPNLNSWISPQILRIRGSKVPVSAMIYRNLVYAGGNALRRNGHSHDQVLLGETAPIGQGTIRTSPVSFYQALFCVDSRGRKLRGSAAKNLGCRGHFKRLPVTGVAHHPYTKGPGVQRLLASQRVNDITIGSIGRLRSVLRQGVHAKAISSGTSRTIFLDEFGVSSRPPAKSSRYGVSLTKQADLLNEFEYLAYVNSGVRGVGQLEYEDDFRLKSRVFQTGLRFANTSLDPNHPVFGKPKPAYAAYHMPLFVVNKGRTFTIWGGVRGVRSGSVTLLKNNKRLKTLRISRGYVITRIPKTSGKFQLSYTPPGGTVEKSRVAKAEKLR